MTSARVREACLTDTVRSQAWDYGHAGLAADVDHSPESARLHVGPVRPADRVAGVVDRMSIEPNSLRFWATKLASESSSARSVTIEKATPPAGGCRSSLAIVLPHAAASVTRSGGNITLDHSNRARELGLQTGQKNARRQCAMITPAPQVGRWRPRLGGRQPGERWSKPILLDGIGGQRRTPNACPMRRRGSCVGYCRIRLGDREGSNAVLEFFIGLVDSTSRALATGQLGLETWGSGLSARPPARRQTRHTSGVWDWADLGEGAAEAAPDRSGCRLRYVRLNGTGGGTLNDLQRSAQHRTEQALSTEMVECRGDASRRAAPEFAV